MPATEFKELYIDPRTDFGFTPKELREYEESVKAYRDIVNAVNTARMEGHEEGREEGIAKGLEEGIAKGLEKGKATGLTAEDIREL